MRVLSGTTPTGRGLHMGNYFGAVRQWIELQEIARQRGGDAFYFIAQYHAMTTVRTAALMAENTQRVALEYLALGLDPERAVLFRQSDIPEVCELQWIFSAITPMGLLERCHAYKDKVAQGISPDHGLFAYPVLMAADILIYLGDTVPVGEDQKQHLEVARDIAVKFNNTYGEFFPLPEPYIIESVGRVPGIDGKKMSGSYGNDLRIFDPEAHVRKQIMAIVTDSKGVAEAKVPDGNVIYELYKLVAPAERSQNMAERFRAGGLGYGDAKKLLFEAFMEFFGPARRRYLELSAKPDEVRAILAEGARKARPHARATMDRVRDMTGLSR